MWNTLAAGLSLASLLAGSSQGGATQSQSAPATLHINQVASSRYVGLTGGAMAGAEAWGTLGASYGMSFGDAVGLEATADLARSGGRLAGLGAVRLLLRSAGPGRERYALVGAAYNGGVGAHGMALVLGGGSHTTITRAVALGAEVQLLFFRATGSTPPIAGRIVIGVLLRTD